jgi:[ribosomal protein S18]-alanine N-acetyltransferase
MRFSFTPMTEDDARAVAAWRYPPPYDVYDMGDSDDSFAELLDRRSPHFAVRDERDALVGFFAFGTAAAVGDVCVPALLSADQTLSVGLGLRPDLTGQRRGLGQAFVLAGLDFARRTFAPAAFRLFVLTFNERAIRVYESAGFTRVGVRHVRNVHGERDFVEMRRPA